MQDVCYTLLSQPEEIQRYLQALGPQPVLAMDIEADSLHAYREQVCLIQVSTPQGNVILDPLSGGKGLAALQPLLENPGILKVFHGGDYDVRQLKRQYGVQVHNVADTMIAAQFTGRSQFGLGALLEEFFGIQADKKYQRANWAIRPLDVDLLRYAALDTAYLMPLWESLRAELETLGRLSWAQEEFLHLEGVTPGPERPPSCFDVKGAGHLEPRQLAVLQALLEVRDQAAKGWNRPPFKVLSNQVLLDWAQTPPRDRWAVEQTPAAHSGTLRRLGPAILEAVRRAQALPPERWPQREHSLLPRPTPEERQRLEALKAARDQVAAHLGLSVGLLVNTNTLEKLSRVAPQESDGVLKGQLKVWQRQVVGPALLAALKSVRS